MCHNYSTPSFYRHNSAKNVTSRQEFHKYSSDNDMHNYNTTNFDKPCTVILLLLNSFFS